MAREEFTIRITRKGEVIVEAENLPPRRVKDLMRYLEETLGPIKSIEGDPGGATGMEELLDDAIAREPEEEETEKTRNPLREDDTT